LLNSKSFSIEFTLNYSCLYKTCQLQNFKSLQIDRNDEKHNYKAGNDTHGNIEVDFSSGLGPFFW